MSVHILTIQRILTRSHIEGEADFSRGKLNLTPASQEQPSNAVTCNCRNDAVIDVLDAYTAAVVMSAATRLSS